MRRLARVLFYGDSREIMAAQATTRIAFHFKFSITQCDQLQQETFQ